MIKKKVKRFNTEFWKEQKRKTLIESTGASMRLSGSKITNEEVEKIIDSNKKRNKEYTLSFVEETIRNREYKGWAGGRMEVLKPDESAYSIDEIRFFTPRNDEWVKFVEEYDAKDIDKVELDKVLKIVKEKFYSYRIKVEKMINHLNRCKSEIIKVLSVNNWRHFQDYFLIREKYLSNNLDQRFKEVFCGFYVMNGARGLNGLQKNEFFKLLSSRKTDLGKILKVLYEIPGYRNSRRLFLSFGTKLLHTINEKLPIYDGNIAHVLELPTQTYPVSLEERIKNRIDIYEELKNRFNMLLANVEIRYYLKDVRQELQSKAELDKFNWQDKYISDTKLLDSSLWALYSILK